MPVDPVELLDVRVADVTSKDQTVHRGRSEISRVPDEFFFANLQLAGECVVRQDGRESIIKAGDSYVVDKTREYDSVAGAKASISKVAYRWGFNNSAHYCRVFRDRFGMSATEYRDRMGSAQLASSIIVNSRDA